MKSRRVIMFLLVSLLTQQVSIGIMNASMFGAMSTSASSELSSGEMMNMAHQQHQIDSGRIVDSAMDMQNMDCCQNDCGNCFTSCQYLISVNSLKFLSLDSKEVTQPNLYEPLVQSLDPLFRPPIVA